MTGEQIGRRGDGTHGLALSDTTRAARAEREVRVDVDHRETRAFHPRLRHVEHAARLEVRQGERACGRRLRGA